MFQLIPEPLLGVSIIVILAAIMSTIDTELFYLSSSIARDFLWKKKLSDKKSSKTIRISIIILALLSMGVAIFVSDILLILFGLLSLTTIVGPVIIGSFFWKLKNNAVFLSMIGGLLALVSLFVTETFTPDTAIMVLPTAVIFLLIGQAIFKK